MCRPLRRQACSHAECADGLKTRARRQFCGSWLACESGGSGSEDVRCAGLFAGKPAPTLNVRTDTKPGLDVNSVGAGLPAKAVDQAARTLDVPAPSQASLLPH